MNVAHMNQSYTQILLILGGGVCKHSIELEVKSEQRMKLYTTIYNIIIVAHFVTLQSQQKAILREFVHSIHVQHTLCCRGAGADRHERAYTLCICSTHQSQRGHNKSQDACGQHRGMN